MTGAFPGVTCQCVRGIELLDVLTDFPGHPGGETVTQAREAQVDLAAGERLPRLVVLLVRGPAGSGRAEQQVAHPLLPDPALRADCQQWGGGQPDGVGLGPHEIVTGSECFVGQGDGDLIGEAHVRVYELSCSAPHGDRPDSSSGT